MKKLLILLLAAPLYSAPTTGEIYICNSGFNFTFKRVIYDNFNEYFQYQVRDETPLLYSITRETADYIYLMRDKNGSASNIIIGKKDNSYVGVYLEHNNSSEVFNGECFIVK